MVLDSCFMNIMWWYSVSIILFINCKECDLYKLFIEKVRVY